VRVTLAVRARLWLERAFCDLYPQTQATNHLVENVIVEVCQLARVDLKRNVTIAEMIGRFAQSQCIRRHRQGYRFGLSHDPHHAARIGFQ
jgi:hypothetical protein